MFSTVASFVLGDASISKAVNVSCLWLMKHPAIKFKHLKINTKKFRVNYIKKNKNIHEPRSIALNSPCILERQHVCDISNWNWIVLYLDNNLMGSPRNALFIHFWFLLHVIKIFYGFLTQDYRWAAFTKCNVTGWQLTFIEATQYCLFCNAQI